MMRTVLTIFAAITIQTQLFAAAQIVGGKTVVTFNDSFLALQLGVSPLGTATLDGAVATFPISGGVVRTGGTALIEHVGSGLSVTDSSVVVHLEDFFIDTTLPLISGRVTVDGQLLAESAPLFAVSPELNLSITPTAATAFQQAFDADGLEGLEIASITTQPVAVAENAIPEPAHVTSILLLMGLAGFGLRHLRS